MLGACKYIFFTCSARVRHARGQQVHFLYLLRSGAACWVRASTFSLLAGLWCGRLGQLCACKRAEDTSVLASSYVLVVLFGSVIRCDLSGLTILRCGQVIQCAQNQCDRLGAGSWCLSAKGIVAQSFNQTMLHSRCDVWLGVSRDLSGILEA